MATLGSASGTLPAKALPLVCFGTGGEKKLALPKRTMPALPRLGETKVCSEVVLVLTASRA
jgi:hypothetical protein